MLNKSSARSLLPDDRRNTERKPRPRRLLAAILAVCLLVAALFSNRGLILRAAGQLLVASDPLQPADIIVVPQWTQEAGALEAADLVRSGVAKRVAVLLSTTRPAEQELIRRGISRADEQGWIARLLQDLRVPTVEEIPNPVSGTEAEGELLPQWCDHHEFRSVVVLSTSDHSRRVRRVLNRAMRNHRTKIIVHLTRYSDFNPGEWWQTRDGVRIEIVEFEKLFLDIMRHPIN